MQYVPDRWMVVELKFSEEMGGGTQTRVLAGWSGGYLDGDSWKLSSPVQKVHKTKDAIEFYNASGSVYVCKNTRHGMTVFSAAALKDLQESHVGKIEYTVLYEYDPEPTPQDNTVEDLGMYEKLDDNF